MSAATPSDTQAWPAYRVRTHNPSAAAENRMHSDAVARDHGFKGALVPGVTVFSHLTQPLVSHLGAAWLARGTAEVTFLKPAYDEELLTIRAAPALADGAVPAYALSCRNEQDVELARMTAGFAAASLAPDPRGELAPGPPQAARPLATWDLMTVGVPFPALAWTPTAADNLAWCCDARDELAIYREAGAPLLHPGFILRQANLVLRNRFTLPAWIHTGSRIVFHAPLRAGAAYEVRAIPEEKWRSKGHEFVRLYVAIRGAGATLAEILHTAIFRLRESG